MGAQLLIGERGSRGALRGHQLMHVRLGPIEHLLELITRKLALLHERGCNKFDLATVRLDQVARLQLPGACDRRHGAGRGREEGYHSRDVQVIVRAVPAPPAAGRVAALRGGACQHGDANPYDDQPEFLDYAKPPMPEEEVQQTFCGT